MHGQCVCVLCIVYPGAYVLVFVDVLYACVLVSLFSYDYNVHAPLSRRNAFFASLVTKRNSPVSMSSYNMCFEVLLPVSIELLVFHVI